jgi:hypothetical protein
MKNIRLLLIFVMFFGALAHSAVFAQPAPAPAPPPPCGEQPAPLKPGVQKPPQRGGAFFENLGCVGERIKAKSNNSVFNTLFLLGVNFAAQTVPSALELGGALALVFIVTQGIYIILGSGADIRSVLAEVGLALTIAGFLILNYEAQITSFAGAGGLLDMVRNITGSDPSLKIMELYGAIFKMIGSAIGQAWSTFSAISGFFHPILATVAAVDLMLTVIFALFILYLCLTGLAEIAGLILTGPFLCAVAVVFGPLFISCLVTPWTREYFSKWVNFVVATAVLTGVLGACLGIAAGLFIIFDFTSITASETPTAIGLAIAAIAITSINSMIQQAPGVSNALVPGSHGLLRGPGAGIRDAGDSFITSANSVGNNTVDKVKEFMKARQKETASKKDAAADAKANGGQSDLSLRYPTLNL